MSLNPPVAVPLPEPYIPLGPAWSGGYSTVYLAHDEANERDVVVKLLRHNDHRIRTMLVREANIMDALHREAPQYFLQPYDVVTDSPFGPYLVMEHAEGGTLYQVLDNGRLPLGEAYRRLTEMARGLDAAHVVGIIHGDIKPANVLLHRGRAVLGDFGIAHRILERDDTPPQPYTRRYSSPEVLRGNKHDAAGHKANDLYALGTVAYEMFCGDTPYTGEDDDFHDGPVPHPRTMNRALGEASSAVLMRVVDSNAALRYATAWEFAEELGEAMVRDGLLTHDQRADACEDSQRPSVEKARRLRAKLVASSGHDSDATLTSPPRFIPQMPSRSTTRRLPRVMNVMALVALAAGLGLLVLGRQLGDEQTRLRSALDVDVSHVQWVLLGAGLLLAAVTWRWRNGPRVLVGLAAVLAVALSLEADTGQIVLPWAVSQSPQPTTGAQLQRASEKSPRNRATSTRDKGGVGSNDKNASNGTETRPEENSPRARRASVGGAPVTNNGATGGGKSTRRCGCGSLFTKSDPSGTDGGDTSSDTPSSGADDPTAGDDPSAGDDGSDDGSSNGDGSTTDDDTSTSSSSGMSTSRTTVIINGQVVSDTTTTSSGG